MENASYGSVKLRNCCKTTNKWCLESCPSFNVWHTLHLRHNRENLIPFLQYLSGRPKSWPTTHTSAGFLKIKRCCQILSICYTHLILSKITILNFSNIPATYRINYSKFLCYSFLLHRQQCNHCIIYSSLKNYSHTLNLSTVCHNTTTYLRVLC